MSNDNIPVTIGELTVPGRGTKSKFIYYDEVLDCRLNSESDIRLALKIINDHKELLEKVNNKVFGELLVYGTSEVNMKKELTQDGTDPNVPWYAEDK